MTEDRSLERAARSWLENGPTQAPDRTVEAALLRIETTPQERDLRIPWRFPTMTPPARIAAAAVIGVLAVGGALFALRPSDGSSVGAPGPSPSATTVPSASAQTIADGRYVSTPQQVADILERIDADADLTTANKDSVIDDLIGIRGHATLQVVLDITGDTFAARLRMDDGPLIDDGTPPWGLTSIDEQTIALHTDCCGVQSYRVGHVDGGFTLMPISPVSSAVEDLVRRILFASSPFIASP